jgi:hypothetical protein
MVEQVVQESLVVQVDQVAEKMVLVVLVERAVS